MAIRPFACFGNAAGVSRKYGNTRTDAGPAGGGDHLLVLRHTAVQSGTAAPPRSWTCPLGLRRLWCCVVRADSGVGPGSLNWHGQLMPTSWNAARTTCAALRPTLPSRARIRACSAQTYAQSLNWALGHRLSRVSYQMR